ncbi:NPCBM/NEW2 domain-containing protein [Streptomyces sp. NPDC047042]|uniref:NPCBM/NEW2 domain-containing protein n=1 Tax=Streptomyces sp. NPDC047042 TaxID=3154807 RepID=UPI0033D172FC
MDNQRNPHPIIANIAGIITIVVGIIALAAFIGIKGCDSEGGGGQSNDSSSVSPADASESVTRTQSESQTTSSAPTKQTPESLNLVEVDPLSSSYGIESGSADVAGKTFPQSVSLRVDKNSIPANDAEYTLGGKWKLFDAAIGVRDDSPTGGRLTFQVFADGASLYSQELAKGEPREIHLKVSGIQTLKIKVSFTAGEYYDNYSYGVWGDARVVK